VLTLASIDRENRILTTTAAGIISRADILDHIALKSTEDLLEFDELFDTRNASFDLSLADLHLVADAVQQSTAGRSHGRVAVVTSNSFVTSLAAAYNAIIGNRQPQLKVFRLLDDAQEWLLDRTTSDDAAPV
jgi:hypothetical protein